MKMSSMYGFLQVYTQSSMHLERLEMKEHDAQAYSTSTVQQAPIDTRRANSMDQSSWAVS
jgi:hypothetical protein